MTTVCGVQGPAASGEGLTCTVTLHVQHGFGLQLFGAGLCTVQLPYWPSGPRRTRAGATASGSSAAAEADAGTSSGAAFVQFSGGPFCGQPSPSVKITKFPSGALMTSVRWAGGGGGLRKRR